MIRSFYVEPENASGSLRLEIDMDFPSVMKNITEMVEFWSGAKDRIQKFKGDVVLAFVEQLSQKVLRMSIDDSFSGIIYKFSEDGNGMEGYYPIDGSCGITLTQLDDVDLDFDVKIEEETA